MRQVTTPMRQLLSTVLLSVALALAGLILVRATVPADLLRPSSDVAGNYLQTVGTIYAVLLAFVVFVVWTQHNEARTLVEREANEMQDLHRIMRSLPEPLSSFAVDQLRDYTDAVLNDEWFHMAAGRECPKARPLLESLWARLTEFEPVSERDKLLYAEALARFNDLSDLRTDRLRASRTRLPSILWLLLISGAVVVVGSMYLFPVERFSIHALMTAAMSGCVSHILFVIRDLDDCFTGDWRIRPDAFATARRHM